MFVDGNCILANISNIQKNTASVFDLRCRFMHWLDAYQPWAAVQDSVTEGVVRHLYLFKLRVQARSQKTQMWMTKIQSVKPYWGFGPQWIGRARVCCTEWMKVAIQVDLHHVYQVCADFISVQYSQYDDKNGLQFLVSENYAKLACLELQMYVRESVYLYFFIFWEEVWISFRGLVLHHWCDFLDPCSTHHERSLLFFRIWVAMSGLRVYCCIGG